MCQSRSTNIKKLSADFDTNSHCISPFDMDVKVSSLQFDVQSSVKQKEEENTIHEFLVSTDETTSEEKVGQKPEIRPLRMKKKKMFSSLDSVDVEKNDQNDEDEIYGSNMQEEAFTVNEVEKKINEWLDARNIIIKDPMEKKDEFYQRKKNLVIKTAHNSPTKELETVDCNSPALNLNMNSGLLLKRKMKSTTVCLDQKPVSLSKFSQN